jgi:hypothetical protein
VKRLSATSVGRPLTSGKHLVLISVKVPIDSNAIVRLEGSGQLKNPTTSSEIKPVTLQIVAQCPNKLHHCTPKLGVTGWQIYTETYFCLCKYSEEDMKDILYVIEICSHL